jgi:hypothetical protein
MPCLCLYFIMLYRATDWVPVAQLPMYVKNLGTSPPSHASGREASQQLLPDATPCLPQTGPLARFKALEGITHLSKASRATPSGCARTHPPDSFLQNKQTTSHPDGMTRAHTYPSVLLKNMRGNDTAVERPPGQSLATRGGSGAAPALQPIEWSKLKTRELLAHPAVTRKTPHSLN